MSKFSIVIPLYNKANSIAETLNSVINQTFSDFEIIIVNDGSTDKSLKVVEKFTDTRIKLLTTKNQGVSAARNFGIKKAQGNYIAFLDADDFWKKNHLELLNMLLNKFPNCGMYCMAYAKKHKSLTYPARYNNVSKVNGWMGLIDDYFESSLKNAIAWTSATMIPKKVLNEIGLFNEKIILGAGEDTDLWIRIALNYSVAFCNTITAIHNLESENRITKSNTNDRKFIDLDVYEPLVKTNKSLKKYLDVNRFSIGIQYKLVGNNKKADAYLKKIDLNSLNKKQRFLINKSTNALRFFVAIQNLLRKIKINSSPFH
ncbi:glycosyltransferase family 2 protein [Hanstruepera ponticola]|uniref:glycosyltransferase family 2 protein n=1 Tax=Hanstruepera ponticola TaxID=2042995 RepID=UPI001781B92E|nr:glycosyltransferase family A protein [Hanstruepera ponticola]